MVLPRLILSAVLTVACLASSAIAQDLAATPAPAAPVATPPRLDAVFKSLQDSTQGPGLSLPWMPIGILAAAIILATIALKQWNRRRTSPKPLNHHGRLLNEAAKAAGMSTRKLKRISSLSQAEGLNSPLVAMLCPSAIKKLATHVKTSQEQESLKSVADQLFRAEKRGRKAA